MKTREEILEKIAQVLFECDIEMDTEDMAEQVLQALEEAECIEYSESGHVTQ